MLRNYMSLIKAAGRDRDVDRAFGIIQRLRENNVSCHIVFSKSFLQAFSTWECRV